MSITLSYLNKLSVKILSIPLIIAYLMVSETLLAAVTDNTLECETDQAATYSNETRQTTLPYVEVPLYTDINGQSIQVTGLYSAILEIPFGFSDFQIINLSFLETIAESNPCHAQFKPAEGLLEIPNLSVPTIIPYMKTQPISGPEVGCQVTLQQSIIRPTVFMLTMFECSLP